VDEPPSDSPSLSPIRDGNSPLAFMWSLHGHNYEVKVILESGEQGLPGFVVDYRHLDLSKSQRHHGRAAIRRAVGEGFFRWRLGI
jgi:hypothetical protein